MICDCVYSFDVLSHWKNSISCSFSSDWKLPERFLYLNNEISLRRDRRWYINCIICVTPLFEMVFSLDVTKRAVYVWAPSLCHTSSANRNCNYSVCNLNDGFGRMNVWGIKMMAFNPLYFALFKLKHANEFISLIFIHLIFSSQIHGVRFKSKPCFSNVVVSPFRNKWIGMAWHKVTFR